MTNSKTNRGWAKYTTPKVETIELSSSQNICVLSYNKSYNYNDAGQTGYVWYDLGNDDIDF